MKWGIKKFFDFIKSGAGLLIVSTIVTNFINFGFNAYLGRHLDLDDFGIVTMMSTFVYLLNFFIYSMSTTVTYAVSFLEGKEVGKGSIFFRKNFINILIPSILSSIVWLFVVPFIGKFLNVSEYSIIGSFAPAIFFGTISAYSSGYLQGTWSFGIMAFLAVFESFSKLILAYGFLHFHLDDFVAVTIPISIFLAFVGSSICAIWVYTKSPIKIDDTNKNNDTRFSLSFYGASLMRGFSTVMFLSLDVILAKHYLSAHDAGVYSLLSIVGKMIYFFGSLLNTFVVTIISRFEGQGKNPKTEFTKLLAGTAFLSIGAGLGVSTLGWYLVPLLLGHEATVIVRYLPLYALAMTLFTLSTTIVLYELARKSYVFPLISTIMSVGMLVAIHLEHSNVHEFVEAITKTNIAYFIVVVFTYFFYSQIKYTYRNIKDILIVWKKLPDIKGPEQGKLNILFFNWRDTKSVFAGGAETYVQSLASRWVREGHSVTLFTSNDGHLSPNGETDGVRIIRRGGFYTTYIIASIYYMWHFRGKFDVIVDSENGIPFFTPLYAKEKVYCLVHHIHQEVFRKQLVWPLAQFAMFLEKDLMPWVYRNCEFITVSDSSKREIERLHITEREIKVVHPGIDTDFLTPGEKALVPTISYVGRLKEHKSVHILIQAFKEVLVQVPGAKLIIAGDGEEESRLKKLVKKLRLGNSVEFHGKVSEEEKREILRSSWVFCTPSMIEGWGITTIEANACGTPVVASDVSGLRDSVKDLETGILVPYGNTKILAEKIILLLQDNNLRDTLSQKAISWSHNFAWDKSAEKFIEIVSDIKLKKNLLNRASFIDTIFGSLVLIFTNKFKSIQTKMPNKIGNFILVEEIHKKDTNKNMSIGVYKFLDKKFLIKRWEGFFKDLGYYSIVNEYNINSIFSKKITTNINIKFPEVTGYIQEKRSLSVIFEYIEGEHLDKADINTQVNTITMVLDFFREISNTLSPEEREFFSYRSGFHYLLILPIISFMSVLFNPYEWRNILVSCYKTMSNFHIDDKYVIAHRDITPDNIMISGNNIYILDSESVVLTIPGYDYAFLKVTPGIKNLTDLLPNDFINKNTYFLKSYIVLHHILGSGDFLKTNHIYTKLLYEINE